MYRVSLAKIFQLFFFIFFLSEFSYAASVEYDISEAGTTFEIKFNRSYSDVKGTRGVGEFIISFKTPEVVNFDRHSFFDSSIKLAYLEYESGRYSFHFVYDGQQMQDPNVITDSKSMKIVFPALQMQPKESAIDGRAYFRMFVGLGIVLGLIYACYAVIRYFFKVEMSGDIPGTGRLLGKVGLSNKHQLAFYELGNIIYIFGLSDSNVTLIDRLDDVTDVAIIKAGFSRRKSFSSYMKFLNKNDLSDDLKDTSDVIEEKISSVKKTY